MVQGSYSTGFNLYIGYTCPLCGSLNLLYAKVKLVFDYNDIMRWSKYKLINAAIDYAYSTIVSDFEKAQNYRVMLGKYKEGTTIYYKGISIKISIPYIDSECQFCGSKPPWISGKIVAPSCPTMLHKINPLILKREDIGKWFGIMISYQSESIDFLMNNEEEKAKFYKLIDETKQQKTDLETSLFKLNKSIKQKREDITLSNALKHIELFRTIRHLDNELKSANNSLNEIDKCWCQLQRWKSIIDDGFEQGTSICERYIGEYGEIDGGIVSYIIPRTSDELEHKELTESIYELIGKKIEIIFPRDTAGESETLSYESTQIEVETKIINNDLKENIELKPAQPVVMFCHKCGNRLRSGSMFCSKCGAKID